MNNSSKIIITNKDLLNGKQKSNKSEYEYTRYEVTKRSDFNQCYVAFYEIPPQKSNYPYHYHEANTEAFYIISGHGLLRTPDGSYEIKQGDVIVCPPTSTGAHKIKNTSSTEKLVYIDFDTTKSPDIVRYPDSNKSGLIIHNQSSTFFRNDSNVNYYDGED